MYQEILWRVAAVINLGLGAGLSAEAASESADVAGQRLQFEVIAEQVVERVCDSRVVLLGELPTHGETRAHEAKAAIVRQLVVECGFSAVLIESGIYDYIGLQNSIDADSATISELDGAIGGFWTTQQLADWRTWLFEQADSGSLYVGGLDDQISASAEHARQMLPAAIADSLAEEAIPCREAVVRHVFWRYDETNPFDREESEFLTRCARDAASASAGSSGPRAQMLENFANYMSRQSGTGLDRDAMMARNLTWHLSRLPTNARVVVWTATVHAARQTLPEGVEPTGALIGRDLGSAMASVGFTTLGGKSLMAGSVATDLEPMSEDSLEYRALSSGVDWAVSDQAELRAMGKVPSRLLGSTHSHNWDEWFDVVVTFKEEVPPSFNTQP